MESIVRLIKAHLPVDVKYEIRRKDLVIKSTSRETTKVKVEKILKDNKIPFISIFKKSKSSSLDVLNVGVGDIIFKPIIQKGAGGLKFEKVLAQDLTNYFNGADYADLVHSDVIKQMESSLNMTPSDNYQIVHEGSKNQKRLLTFNGNNISISNSTGETLTDITIKNSKRTLFLSLKLSQTYYIFNGAIDQYFKNSLYNSKLCTYLGLDGLKMGGFGADYQCTTPKPEYSIVKRNIENILKDTYGKNVVLIHKKSTNNVIVDNITSNIKVTVSNLNQDSYIYPEKGIRKYANIKFKATIDSHTYKVQFQFRGTTAADVGPKYLRILMERV